MPRGKCTNVYMICQNKVADRNIKDDQAQKNRGKGKKSDNSPVNKDEKCEMQNYTTRMNKKTFKSLEFKRYCNTCQTHTMHKNGSEIKHSSGNK